MLMNDVNRKTCLLLARLLLLLSAVAILPLCAQTSRFRPAWPVLALAASGTNPLQTLVVPNAFTNTEANFGNRVPFGADISGQTNRYQQVYAASEFAATGPIVIKQIAFRPNAFDGSGSGLGQAFSTTIPQIQISLSTTHAAPDALSATFADNVGANNTLVFSGSLPLSSANIGPTTGPKQFDVVIPLATPFHYNPAAGNLLLDVKTLLGVPTTYLDAESLSGDSVSRASSGWSYTTAGSDAVTASFIDSIGLVTQFGYKSVTSACGAEDVTAETRVFQGGLHPVFPTQHSYSQTVTVTNISGAAIPGPLYLLVQGLPPGVLLTAYKASRAHCFAPRGDYLVPLPAGSGLGPSSSVSVSLVFFSPKLSNIVYTTKVLSGVPNRKPSHSDDPDDAERE